MTTDRRADVVRAVFDLPLHRSLGLRPVADGDPSAGVELPVSEGTVNPSAVLHGGLVPLLLDVTCFLRLLEDLPEGSHAVTVSTSSSIIAAAREGDVVRCTAQVDRLGRTHAFLSAEVRVGDKVVATGQVVKAVVPG
ncbi:PaaI family thioesterase [Nocardioides sp.]|uniref:PaaI family thioesterase n=1 Tax=Nocardioides sp. TaxID=35761 RepID=UPI002B278DA1|nr:PaaI family thioesterase [Nocardioides sp.]